MSKEDSGTITLDVPWASLKVDPRGAVVVGKP
jgi:hypothetical protein